EIEGAGMTLCPVLDDFPRSNWERGNNCNIWLKNARYSNHGGRPPDNLRLLNATRSRVLPLLLKC
ncbi:MAG: hypothetical protein ACRD4F_09110, partial [Candidatus Angelobacter sp.]